MRTPIERLLNPATVALIGGGWTDHVAAANRTIGYQGELWRVHPTRRSTAEARYYRRVEDLPGVPDAAFIAVPNRDVPQVAGALARRGAGGFVCFSAGFTETGTEEGAALTNELLRTAGTLPFLGPNCYGSVNFFDQVALWPDQLVGEHLERGVALICQSGTLALTLMFNRRSLPIGYILTVGNQTRLAVEDLIEILADDPRVSAFGLYIEGIKDAQRFAAAADQARRAGKPIAVVKTGRTEIAARTAQSHTGSLAGADAVFDTFCRQAGLARCDTLGCLIETLKLFHAGGPLRGRRVLVMGASGGDMAMTADVARDLELNFAPIPESNAVRLREILSERVTIANPFDFHTYIWFDRPALKRLFTEVRGAGYDTVALMVDCPPTDRADASAYTDVIEEFVKAAPAGSTTRAAMICSLPETLPESTRSACLAAGVVPLQGQRDALQAIDLAARVGAVWQAGAQISLRVARRTGTRERSLTEVDAKRRLAEFGIRSPRANVVPVAAVADAATDIGFPVVLKASGESLQHKSDLGGVIVNVRTAAEATAGAARLAALSPAILVEEMVTDGVAEVLVGVTVDAQFGQVLVVGAGGILTELLRDSVSLLPPFTRPAIHSALSRLSVARLLTGYRGRPAGDTEALVDAILGVARFAQANADTLIELDVNPVIVRPAGSGAIAVDALIRLAEEL